MSRRGLRRLRGQELNAREVSVKSWLVAGMAGMEGMAGIAGITIDDDDDSAQMKTSVARLKNILKTKQ